MARTCLLLEDPQGCKATVIARNRPPLLPLPSLVQLPLHEVRATLKVVGSFAELGQWGCSLRLWLSRWCFSLFHLASALCLFHSGIFVFLLCLCALASSPSRSTGYFHASRLGSTPGVCDCSFSTIRHSDPIDRLSGGSSVHPLPIAFLSGLRLAASLLPSAFAPIIRPLPVPPTG